METNKNIQALTPLYYVRHPDDSYSVADPQPVPVATAAIQGDPLAVLTLGGIDGEEFDSWDLEVYSGEAIDKLQDQLVRSSEPVILNLYAAELAARPPADAATAFPPRDLTKPAEQQGIFEKFSVQRTDGSDAPGGKHHGCKYFVIDLDHDQYARAAMRAYAAACRATHPLLADDIESEWGKDDAAQPSPAQGDALSQKVCSCAHIGECDGLCAPYIAPHPDDEAIDRFAIAMKAKMAASRAKGRSGWADEAQCSESTLARKLIEHVAKGDPVDIANFAMMLHQREAVAVEHHPCNGGQAKRAIAALAQRAASQPVLTDEQIANIILHLIHHEHELDWFENEAPFSCDEHERDFLADLVRKSRAILAAASAQADSKEG